MCRENYTTCMNLKKKSVRTCVRHVLRLLLLHLFYRDSSSCEARYRKSIGMGKLIGSKYLLSSFAVFEFQGRERPAPSTRRTSFERRAKQTGDCRKVSSQIGFLTWQELSPGDLRICPFRLVDLARAQRGKERKFDENREPLV